MHRHDISRWQHDHNFTGEFSRAERNTRRVIALTAAMMIIEIVTGIKFNSMALLADGWHMSTHVAAFLIAAAAYALARKHANNRRYSFGTGKMGVLGAFASAIILGGIAVMMAGESLQRFFSPMEIHFNEAILVACIGFLVNVISAFLLRDHHHHHHGQGHDHGHHHGHEHHHHGGDHHHDVNLKAAYLHVIADALTSVFAIIALLGGKMGGWVWLDPVMGIVGSVVISWWAYGLVRDTIVILLDKEPEHSDLNEEIHKALENDGDTAITDLHIWQIGVNKYAAIVALVAHQPQSPEEYKTLLKEHEELVHVTVEVHQCQVETNPA
jgi:cation diffusion facilitator family transporter